MLRTLRGRLAALAMGITLAVCLLVCAALYIGIRYSLYREVDTFLAGEVMEFQSMLADSAGDLPEVERRIRAELGSRQRGDLAFRLLSIDGRVLLTSETGAALPDPWSPPARRETDMFFRTETPAGARGLTRTCSQWIAPHGGETRIVQATYLLDQVNHSLDRFMLICASALGAAAVLASIGGRIVARRGLSPLRRMASSARRISVENLTQRLERTNARDELDHLAETFNDMLGRLERQVAQLRQFTADAAHELRTPLAALRGTAEVALSAARSNEELRATLADGIEEYDRLSRIADDLLLLARADAGQDFLRRAPFRLDTAVADVVDLYSATAEDRGVKLVLEENGKVWIGGDDGRLRQMLGNLLDNAIKFTPAGGDIRVSLRVVESHAGGVAGAPAGGRSAEPWAAGRSAQPCIGGEPQAPPGGGGGASSRIYDDSRALAEIAVRDTGVGIPMEHIDRVFDRFYRVDKARSREAGGAGLGLSICRTIVQAHRGVIELASEQSRGTTVRVRLPVHEPVT